MHKNRRITLHQNIGKGIKFNYITSKITFKNVSGIQNVIIYVGTVCVLSATLILSKNSRVLDAKSRLID